MRYLLPALASAAWALFSVSAPAATDDFKIIKLEQDVRNLERQVQMLSRQIDELKLQLTRAGDRSALPPAASRTTASPTTAGDWLDASKWERLRRGMNELEVISTLGPPTSMREENGNRVLLYAMEIGSSGFLSGSVSLRDRVVVDMQKPALR